MVPECGLRSAGKMYWAAWADVEETAAILEMGALFVLFRRNEVRFPSRLKHQRGRNGHLAIMD